MQIDLYEKNIECIVKNLERKDKEQLVFLSNIYSQEKLEEMQK